MRRTRALCAFALILAATGCASPKPPPADGLSSKSWDEQKILLPPYPRADKLVPIYVGPAVPFAFYVDPASISIGADRVARYTLVARSASAATNVAYEGIRCETYERRTYALGRPDGTWAQARNSEWLPISRLVANQHAALADDFFCTANREVRTVEEAAQAFARGNRP